jgi:hypothetical protein
MTKRAPIPTIASVIRLHQPTGFSTGGILAECDCGTAYDDRAAHLQEVILRDCFPHLSALHERLVTEPYTFPGTRPYDELVHENWDLHGTVEAVKDWVDEYRGFAHTGTFTDGFRAAQQELGGKLVLWEHEDAERATRRAAK